MTKRMGLPNSYALLMPVSVPLPIVSIKIGYNIYRMAFVNTATEGLGLACALTWVMSIGVLLITFLNFKLSNKWVYYD